MKNINAIETVAVVAVVLVICMGIYALAKDKKPLCPSGQITLYERQSTGKSYRYVPVECEIKTK